MNPDRRKLLIVLPAAASAALTSPSLLAKPQTENTALRIEPAGTASFLPLQQVTLHVAGSGGENGTVVILDGAGREYLRAKAGGALPFVIGGALGRQTARLLDRQGVLAAELEFMVDCSTRLNDEGGVYQALMEAVLWTMMSWNQNYPVTTIRHQDRVYQLFVNWIFDHTLTMKGMKYFWPDLKDAVDFFADTQREDGMIWENCYPSTPDYNYFDWKFHYDDFVRRIGGGFWQLRKQWRNGIAHLLILLRARTFKIVIVRKRLDPACFAHCQAAALSWVVMDVVVPIFGNVRHQGG